MPRLTTEEAARIAMQYDAVVPEDIEVQKVPCGVGRGWISMPRKEVVKMARRVYQRGKKFQRAKVKADGRAESNN
jgi:hypothetical protein